MHHFDTTLRLHRQRNTLRGFYHIPFDDYIAVFFVGYARVYRTRERSHLIGLEDILQDSTVYYMIAA